MAGDVWTYILRILQDTDACVVCVVIVTHRQIHPKLSIGRWWGLVGCVHASPVAPVRLIRIQHNNDDNTGSTKGANHSMSTWHAINRIRSMPTTIYYPPLFPSNLFILGQLIPFQLITNCLFGQPKQKKKKLGTEINLLGSRVEKRKRIGSSQKRLLENR